VPLLPALAIVAVLAAVAFLGFGSRSEESDVSQKRVAQKVDALLKDVPQDGTSLGSPNAPITLTMFADLECPTVKRFAEAYLPSVVETWVRSGVMRIDYRSLETDTVNEGTFFEQEVAALAAGRQDKMWDFVLTFLFEQGQEGTDYATDEFFTDVASQVAGLKMTRWRHDRDDARLSRRVAVGVYTAHSVGMSATPSFLIEVSSDNSHQSFKGKSVESIKEEAKISLRKVLASLAKEAVGDVPVIKAASSLG